MFGFMFSYGAMAMVYNDLMAFYLPLWLGFNIPYVLFAYARYSYLMNVFKHICAMQRYPTVTCPVFLSFFQICIAFLHIYIKYFLILWWRAQHTKKEQNEIEKSIKKYLELLFVLKYLYSFIDGIFCLIELWIKKSIYYCIEFFVLSVWQFNLLFHTRMLTYYTVQCIQRIKFNPLSFFRRIFLVFLKGFFFYKYKQVNHTSIDTIFNFSFYLNQMKCFFIKFITFTLFHSPTFHIMENHTCHLKNCTSRDQQNKEKTKQVHIV